MEFLIGLIFLFGAIGAVVGVLKWILEKYTPTYPEITYLLIFGTHTEQYPENFSIPEKGEYVWSSVWHQGYVYKKEFVRDEKTKNWVCKIFIEKQK